VRDHLQPVAWLQLIHAASKLKHQLSAADLTSVPSVFQADTPPAAVLQVKTASDPRRLTWSA